MTNCYTYLGNSCYPYRSIMENHTDFHLSDRKLSKNRIVNAEQVHSRNVHACIEIDSGAGFDDHLQISDCDALITNVPDQFLMIRTADCIPILIFDRSTNSIGAVHSGREGTRLNIIGNAINLMKLTYAANPCEFKIWLGASICKQHYQVSAEVWTEFVNDIRDIGFAISDDDFPYVDLKNLVIQQLIREGINPYNIFINNSCTYESSDFFSYRRDRTQNRQISVIGLVNG